MSGPSTDYHTVWTADSIKAAESKGHIGWFRDQTGQRTELYRYEASGDIHRAPESSCIDVGTGNRIGRFVCSKHQANYIIEQLLACVVAR